MTRLIVALDMDGAAFDGSMNDVGFEVGRILLNVGHRLANGEDEGKLLDINGNAAGWWAVRYGLELPATDGSVRCPECATVVDA